MLQSEALRVHGALLHACGRYFFHPAKLFCAPHLLPDAASPAEPAAPAAAAAASYDGFCARLVGAKRRTVVLRESELRGAAREDVVRVLVEARVQESRGHEGVRDDVGRRTDTSFHRFKLVQSIGRVHAR